MKLVPQYSIRLMLGITALVACVFSIVGLAVRGHSWAIGISLGVVAIAIALATYAALFGILWVFSVVSSPLLNRQLRARQTTLAGTASPFASGPPTPVAERALEAIILDTPSAAAGEPNDRNEGGADCEIIINDDSNTTVDESTNLLGGDQQA